MIESPIQAKKILVIAGVVLSAAAVYFLSVNHTFSGNKMGKIKINEEFVFEAEIASGNEKLKRGLAGRKSICETCGMLFEFKDSGRHAFWMKGMKFDLDILWVSRGEIVYIAENVSHDSREIITPRIESDKVLEINAGIADKAGIKVGDRLKQVE